MTFFQKMSESAGLVSGMAERLGVDLEARMSHAETAAPSYADMVTRCATCSDHAACTKLQDENPLLEAAPDFCMNKNVLNAHKRR